VFEVLDDPLQGLAVLLLFLCPGIGLTQRFGGLDGLLLFGMDGETELVNMILVFLVHVQTGIKKGNCRCKLPLLHMITRPIKEMISEVNPPTCHAGVVVKKQDVGVHSVGCISMSIFLYRLCLSCRELERMYKRL
jgi:hypothetical protein